MPDYSKRKLTIAMRRKILELAGDTFIDTALRQIEDEKQKILVESIRADIKTIPKAEMEFAKKYRLTSRIGNVQLCDHFRLRGEKEFTLPSGKVVKRQGDHQVIMRPKRRSFDIDEYTWGGIATGNKKRRFYGLAGCWGREAMHSVDLLNSNLVAPVKSSAYNGADIRLQAAEGYRATKVKFDGLTVDDEYVRMWISETTLQAAQDWWLAAVQRSDKEDLLIKGVYSFLDNAETYGQVVDFWPEVTQIEEKLFGPKPTENALVKVEPEAVEAVCAHMKDRGIESKACALAA